MQFPALLPAPARPCSLPSPGLQGGQPGVATLWLHLLVPVAVLGALLAWAVGGGDQMLADRSSASRRSRDTASWVVARLPALITTNTRSPGYSNTCSLRCTRTSSSEALVRVSAAKTRPSSTSMPTQ